jgi:hypothetical protein
VVLACVSSVVPLGCNRGHGESVLLLAEAEGIALLAPLDAGIQVVSLRPGLGGVCCCSTLGLCAN